MGGQICDSDTEVMRMVTPLIEIHPVGGMFLVRYEIAPYVVVAGNPLKILGYRQ